MFHKIYLNGNYTLIQLMNIIKEHLHNVLCRQSSNHANVDQIDIQFLEQTNTLTF